MISGCAKSNTLIQRSKEDIRFSVVLHKTDCSMFFYYTAFFAASFQNSRLQFCYLKKKNWNVECLKSQKDA